VCFAATLTGGGLFHVANHGDSLREKCCAAGDLLRGCAGILLLLHHVLFITACAAQNRGRRSESAAHIRANDTNVEREERLVEEKRLCVFREREKRDGGKWV
ncbi:Hypothetical predicted protein, partial [Olea europaea subsp. europaea]